MTRDQATAILILHGWATPCMYPGQWQGVMRGNNDLLYIMAHMSGTGNVHYTASFSITFRQSSSVLAWPMFNMYSTETLRYLAEAAERENGDDT